jgi:NAD(P)-dependent dehydrogenase (short-subunit alcohol dehydrogenase family)
MGAFDGQGVVVTGAGRGIGRALAVRAATEGARVVVNDLDPGTAQAVADEIGGTAVPGDVSSTDGVRAVIDSATEALGRIDVFFANAGIDGAGKGASGGDSLQTPDDVWDRIMDVNVMAHIRAARELVPRWLEDGQGGRFVVTASAAGVLTMIGSAPYSVTKHAAVGFAEWLSITYGDSGIGVSCVCPMGVDTPLLSGILDSPDPVARMAGAAVATAGDVIGPDQVAAMTVDAVRDGRFLVLPHPAVLDMYRRKGDDYERWLAGMRRYQGTLG